MISDDLPVQKNYLDVASPWLSPKKLNQVAAAGANSQLPGPGWTIYRGLDFEDSAAAPV